MVQLESSTNAELKRDVTPKAGQKESGIGAGDKLAQFPSISRLGLNRASSRAATRAGANFDSDCLRSGHGADFAHIEHLHAQLLGRVEALADGKLQPDHIRENEHLRSFRLRLCKTEEELARKKDAPETDWKQEALDMADELEGTHRLVCQLEHQIKVFQGRLQNLQSQAEEREEENRLVLQQVAALEKENVKLKMGSPAPKLAQPHAQGSWRSKSTTGRENTTPVPSNRPQTAGLPASERRQLEDAIRRYKKLLDAESQRTREARAAHLAVEIEFQKFRATVGDWKRQADKDP